MQAQRLASSSHNQQRPSPGGQGLGGGAGSLGSSQHPYTANTTTTNIINSTPGLRQQPVKGPHPSNGPLPAGVSPLYYVRKHSSSLSGAGSVSVNRSSFGNVPLNTNMNTLPQHTLSTPITAHPVNTPPQHTLSTYLSIHAINIPSILYTTSPSQPAFST